MLKENKKRKKRRMINTKFNFNKLLLLGIPIFIIGGSIAKYVNEKNADIIFEAKSFYFESDLLSDNTEPSAYTYNKGNDTIILKIMNNIDELRYSEVDIEYVVDITDINGNSIQDQNGNKVESVNGKLLKGSIDSDTIEFTNLASGNYLIKAKALSPYTKTIQATFVITENNEKIEYQVNDSVGSNILRLTVLSEDYTGNVSLTWPANVVPDSTDKNFENVNTGYEGGTKVISFSSNSEYTFQFFKKDSSLVYTSSDFAVERSK